MSHKGPTLRPHLWQYPLALHSQRAMDRKMATVRLPLSLSLRLLKGRMSNRDLATLHRKGPTAPLLPRLYLRLLMRRMSHRDLATMHRRSPTPPLLLCL